MNSINSHPDIERGDALRDSGALEQAIEVYREVIATSPGLALAHYKLGTALARLERNEEAEASYLEALRLQPHYAEAANNLGILLEKHGRSDDAETLYRDALAQRIDYFEAHHNLANLLAKGPRHAEALYYFQRAVELRPESALAWEGYGALLHKLSRIADSKSALEKAIKVDPTQANAWANLARCHWEFGQLPEASKCYQQAIALDEKSTTAWQNLVFGSNYRSEDRRSVFETHVSFAEHLTKTLPTDVVATHANAVEPLRRLRVGFVSGDLRRHSVSHFIDGPVANLDPLEIEAWAYYNFPTEDFRTQELKPLFAEWRNIYGVKDADVADIIRRDRIDILVDLSGATSHARLRTFALKPAPIQVSWIGYPNTTGLAAMDYRFTDEWADPTGDSEEYHRETLVRLPECFLCYSPPRNAPAISEAPHLQRGYVTFGSFNTRVKIGEETLALWARVMSAVPQARLAVKSVGGFKDQAVRAQLMEQMSTAGIDPGRVTLHVPEQALADHLALYSDIDIALDTYPYNGTTTTCEALWMGVPVITMAGDRHAARVGVSLLSNIGLPELIAKNADDFVRIATALAANSEKVVELRTNMRERLRASPLLDGKAMARKLEQAFRMMWRTHCEKRPETSAGAIESDRYIVNMQGGYRMCVAPDPVTSLSTWVVLEQEDWFEDEIRFVRNLCTPSWHALDIGANHGVYALSLASSGAAQVWAFEPTSEPRLKLRDSIALNDFEDRVHVLPYGLSSVERSANIALSQHSELNSIHSVSGEAKGQETIALRPLDDLFGKEIPVDACIDFVKLDAAGEEVAILRGGLRFFCTQSPLLVFDYKHGDSANAELLDTLRALGYGIFRLLPALECLLPVSPGEEATLSAYTLNLFACKHDMASALEAQRQLLQVLPSTAVPRCPEWIQELLQLPVCGNAVVAKWESSDLDSDYGRALLAWCGSRSKALPLSDRYQLLAQSFDHIQTALSNEDTHPATAILCIRICSDIGLRVPALSVANEFMQQMTPEEEFPLDRPLPPAYAAFDTRQANTSLGAFIYQSVVEFLIDRTAYSLFFLTPQDWLLKRGLNSPERTPRLERSVLLNAARNGVPLQLALLSKVFQAAPDNLNPDLWHELVKRFAPATKTESSDLTSDTSQALALYLAGKPAEALSYAESALINAPQDAPLLNIAANAAKALGDLHKAETLWRAAITALPAFAEAHNDLGILLMETKRFEAAEAAFRRALEIHPDYAPTHNNLGIVLMEMQRFEAAEVAYRRLLEIQPGNAEAYCNLGVLLKVMKRFAEAEKAYRRALEIRPEFGNAAGEAYFCANQVCDWSHRDQDEARLADFITRGIKDISPFTLLTLSGISGASAALLQRRAGQICAENDYQVQSIQPLVDERHHPQGAQLRIGYVSADFHEHATMHLLGGVLSAHDRSRFVVHGYSYGTTVDARTRQAEDACDVFRDVRSLSDHAVAELIAADGIDILVDLKGYTQHTRLEITAMRPAPVIVSWLGYPGTLGHPRLADYIIGDPIVTPPEHAAHFSETLALMPHCYQPNHRQRVIGAKPSRMDAGLPETGFVFCCFNHSFKFDPETFDLWCRLLLVVPGSVLWLLEPTTPAIANLRREAAARGLDPSRLLFAPMKPLTQHLGRLQLADLALDTFPYTSHTTASDALWAGVPLVTRIGDTFASRVAASLLQAVGLSDLVTSNGEEYFSLALALASAPERLAAIRQKLELNRLTMPLFDTARFTQNLERLYASLWEQHRQGEKGIIVLTDA
ncbi:MAG TPA: FkbM family methyltransferase [Rhodocyclaceae bacterium]